MAEAQQNNTAEKGKKNMKSQCNLAAESKSCWAGPRLWAALATPLDVAVKVFDLEMRGAERSFMSECEALRSIQHRNLLRIITCLTVDREGNALKALVYEFMPNGSLDRWLHHKGDTKSPKHLGLTQRIGA